MGRKRVLDVLVSPTTRCNLRCRYCYVNQCQNQAKADLSLDEIAVAYRWLDEFARLTGAERIRLTWFGGEPLYRGVAFLREAVALQATLFSPSLEVVNTMQSNLTLVNDDLIPLLKKSFHGSIGGSIDFQGVDRVFPNGENSLAVAEKNVRRLRNAGICVGIVCTLTKSNSGDPEALYTYYKRLGTPFRVNRAAGTTDPKGLFLSIDEYNGIVKKLFDIYLSDPCPTVEFTNFAMMAKLYLAGLPVVCVDTLTPCLFLGIEAQGRIMSRCRFAGQLGNFMTDSPGAFYEKCQQQACGHPAPMKCRGCEFFNKVCLGGCPGEPDADCFNSHCGYRTETTYELWRYVQDYLSRNGHTYAELREFA